MATAPGSAVEGSTLDAAALERVAEMARRLDQLNSLIVAQGGEIAFGEAFRGPPLDRPANVKSVSKTLVAALTGAALDRDLISGPDQPLSDLLADLIPEGADPRVGRITVADLLTMQAGLQRTSGAFYGDWVQSRDWVRYALSRPFVAEPGARMLYSTGSYHLLGAALSRATGRSLLALARDWLGDPLEIEIPPWTRDPQGFYLGGNNMRLSPLALLRFGEAYRLGGLWRETRVLSADWVEASWQPRTYSPFSRHDYGYGWFLTRARGHPVAYARGYGGQMLYVLPSLALTVVVTSDPTRPARSGGYVGDLNALLAEQIVPAAEGV
ncbi:serine hydrolase domain-containing protein [Algihabitans albus]|uniref:serine hydrolase domain-containing protein n=1 Tax=Algihabitans albus TaxID=2164067 RepID=UPI001F42B15B|nr:serine hydrolase [Algihabitans albus]